MQPYASPFVSNLLKVKKQNEEVKTKNANGLNSSISTPRGGGLDENFL